jgi:hypothetical protein
MLSLFKKNGFVNSFLLLAYTIVLHIIPLVMGHSTEKPEGMAGWLAGVFHIFLVFVQAVFINRMIIENRLHRDIMLYPGVFFILFSALLPSFWGYHHFHLANFFTIWALFELFQIYKITNPASHIFNASFMIGIASIFCPPYFIYLLLLFVGISNLKKMEIVHPLQILVGGLVPWFLYITYQVYRRKETAIADWLDGHFGLDFFGFQGGWWVQVHFIGFALLCLFLFLSYNEIRKKKHIQAQKKVDILFMTLFFSLLVIFSHHQMANATLLIAGPCVGIFIGLLISHIKNHSLAELIHLLLFVGVIVIQLFTFFTFGS